MVMVVMMVVAGIMVTLFGAGESGEAEGGETEDEEGFHGIIRVLVCESGMTGAPGVKMSQDKSSPGKRL